MDNLNSQTQTPNPAPASPDNGGPSVVSPLSQIPPESSVPEPIIKTKKGDSWFVIAIIAIGAFGGYALWLVGQAGIEPVYQQYSVSREVREDILISNDLENTDLGDIDLEFKSIDEDISSL